MIVSADGSTWLSNFEQAQVNLAIALADSLLFGQVDRHGEPLIHHCQRVASALWVSTGRYTVEQYLVAFLHDCIEDGACAAHREHPPMNDAQRRGTVGSLVVTLFEQTVSNLV